jgi:predicted RNA-binding protein with PIN domain
MSLHLVIDGYNLIRQSPWLSVLDARDLEAGREALLAALSEYRQRRPQHKVTVIFDGWQGGALQESRDLCRGVGVIYSRRGERADEVIKRMLAREGRRVVLRIAQGGGEADEEPAPTPRGRAKKGNAHRLKKSLRQKKDRLRKL